MNSKEIITKSDQETKELAGEIAQEMLGRENSEALVIGLEGDLGSGKTTFIQGIAQGLGIKDKITSPTFVIMKKY
ncbi:tRNA (adenosine(37)-N6)-threonylcarbamoyltransferase complex ATPase subunit type 1 TsaE, partial [Patescibacteria group bacterium]|nr:tRNA (adenosine(37)-N6)-threonylcarbamoyltransferase complex ATPase subunit type 1 TsaE [Patescibacteria group bacterium]